jgi:hypothetical protein
VYRDTGGERGLLVHVRRRRWRPRRHGDMTQDGGVIWASTVNGSRWYFSSDENGEAGSLLGVSELVALT